MTSAAIPLLKSTLVFIAALLLAGCLQQETLTTVPDAENILFTAEGDLIVSGGRNIYQITEYTDALGKTGYHRRAMYDDQCMFAGIVQQGEWVITVCQEYVLQWSGFFLKLVRDNHLLAANVHQRPLTFQRLDKGLRNDPVDALALPNGMAVTPDGHLLLADGNFFAKSGVARIRMDYSSDLPRVTGFDRDWIGSAYGLSSANGVRVQGQEVFISDGNKVRRLTFDQAGNLPLELTDSSGGVISNRATDNVIYQGGIIIDDIMPICGGVAVTQFVSGQLVYVNRQGQEYATQLLSLESPSSLAIGQPPLFSGSDLIVTEKGILYDHISTVGNKLTRVPMGLDLTAPDVCALY